MLLRLVFVPLALIGVLAAVGLASRDDAEPAAEPAPRVQLIEIERFDQPVHVGSPPGDARLFVVEKKGRIWVFADGRKLGRPFLDLSAQVSSAGNEEGLLSIAFAPDYATSGRFYVDYTDLRHRTVVEEFRPSRDPNVADPGTARKVLVIPNANDYHHGGHLLFGPDGSLYISQGDGGTSTPVNFPAQRLDNLHGKVLRIDPRPQAGRSYGIPTDNPFVGRPGRDEIWHYGLRNPWRLAIDPETAAMAIGDAGQLSVEEVDLATGPGQNFGWSCFEGRFPYHQPGPASCEETVPPAIDLVRLATPVSGNHDEEPTVTRGRPRVETRFRRAEQVCSVVVGVFVQDPALQALRGRHVYGDFCRSSLFSFRLDGGRAVDVQPLGLDVLLLSSFGVDSEERVYLTSLTGPVYRLEPAE